MAPRLLTLLAPVLMAWGAQSARVVNSVTTAPNPPQVGAAFTKLTINFQNADNTGILFATSGGTIEISFDTENVFAAGPTTLTAGTHYTLTYDGTDATTGRTVSATAKKITISGGADIAAVATAKPFVLEILAAANMVTPQTATTVVKVTAKLDGTSTPAFTAWTVAAANVMSDPITFFNGVKTKFWLPPVGYTNLIQTPDVQVLAKPLDGPGDLQWFESFKLVWSGEGTSTDVRVVNEFTSPLSTEHGFVGEQVAVNYSKSFHKIGALQFASADGRFLSVVRTEPHGIARTHGKYELESVCSESPSITFCIYASHAGNEFPGDLEMQKKYVHLDFTVTSSLMPLKEYTGVLPELWELIPMSEAVRNMTKPPSASKAAPACILPTAAAAPACAAA